MYRNISLRLKYGDTPASTSSDMWWEVKENCDDENFKILNKIPFVNCEQLVMYTFNDKLFPATLNFISGSGLVTAMQTINILYITKI